MAAPPPPPPAPAPPAAPPVQQQGVPPTPAQRSGCGRGCGFGCGGCLIAAVLVVVLVLGGGYWFFVVQASAAVDAPATLVVINQPVTVNGHPGIPGESLNPGDTVATQEGGHALVQFADGSFVRLSPNTTAQVTSAQLQKDGRLKSAGLADKVGRVFADVQHLASGATFQVSGHAVTAVVRGTQFEVLVRPDGTNRIWVFVGTVTVNGRTSATLTAGQEIDADASGNLTNRRANQFDNTDAFPMTAQCSAAAIAGNTSGTVQASAGGVLSNGQSAEDDYSSPGGNLTVVLCYPGSLMSVTLVDPLGAQHTRQGPPPLAIRLPNAPPGRYRAVVHALNVPAGGEAYSVAFATDASCTPGNIDDGTIVRWTLSNTQISNAIATAGSTGVTLQVQGTSSNSATLVYYSNLGGVSISWTIAFYAATPNLGVVLTQATVQNINVTTQLVSQLTSYAHNSISSLPSGFIVDRVYSCTSPSGDGLMVIEGHR